MFVQFVFTVGRYTCPPSAIVFLAIKKPQAFGLRLVYETESLIFIFLFLVPQIL